MKILFYFFILFFLSVNALSGQDINSAEKVLISHTDSTVTLANANLSIEFNLIKETYNLKDNKNGIIILQKSRISADDWNSPHVYGSRRIGKAKGEWKSFPVSKNKVNGLRLELYFIGSPKNLPEYRFAFTIYENSKHIEMQSGIKNGLDYDCRFMKSEFISNGVLFPGYQMTSVMTLNGAAGVTVPQVWGDTTRESYNSLLLTTVIDGKRYSIVWGGLKYEYFYATALYRKSDRTISLFMKDPHGKLISQNEEWWAPDTYYIGVEENPFFALEKYGLALREANNANPNVYDFPTLCGWAVGNLSGGKDINNSAALVEEMDNANKCGLTKYTKVAVRLEPDYYCYDDGNTQQGWWDDAHWSKYGSLVPPYETFAKWCKAVKDRNGVPFTYFQSGMPSDDFARAHPDWMLYNDISKLNVYHRHHQPYVRYDYTDPGFQNHVLSMWKRLRKDGMIGIKFDYPETAWNPGGFEDPKATTTSAYRNLFALCREGLGPEARIHERALGESDRPTLDVTAGIVDMQRTAWDNNAFEVQFVSTGGLRWYKAGSVFRYYPDSKAIHPHNKEIRQSLLTMMAFTSGRLELATPFNMLTPEMVYDIARIYPAYTGLQSPRPLDAFTGINDPCVYDLPLTADWHQLVLFNSGKDRSIITTDLGKKMIEGGMELDPLAEYHIYDFWNDSYAGKHKGNFKLSKELNPLACALFSVRKAEKTPQLISTNRHILQGWMEIKDLKWENKSLSGKASVVENEPFKIVIAANGWKLQSAYIKNKKIKIADHSENKDLKILTIISDVSEDINWSVKFK